MANTNTVPAVGTLVRPVGSSIRYRVVQVIRDGEREYGCRVEAVDTEVVAVPGRKPRPLHYTEKRASLAVSREDGRLFDDQWRGWEVIS